jgi:hypothetical protein
MNKFYSILTIFLTLAKPIFLLKNENLLNKTNSNLLPFKCTSNMGFECLTSKKCIKLTQVCDKEFDCPDRSDEYNCNCNILSTHIFQQI